MFGNSFSGHLFKFGYFHCFHGMECGKFNKLYKPEPTAPERRPALCPDNNFAVGQPRKANKWFV